MNLLMIFWLGITAVQGANILITYETARRSHQIWITQLAEALVAKGHNITLGGSFSRAIPASDGYHPITFEGIFMAHYKVNKTAHLFANPLRRIHLNHDYNYAICNKTYHSKGFNSLWNYPDNFTFDLILMDMSFGPCLYPLIERFGRPYTIGFTPSALTPYLSELFGNGGYPSYFASPLLEPLQDRTFFSRLKNYLLTKFEIFFKKTFELGAIEKLAESLLNRTFEFGELEKGISLLFVNEYPLLNEPKALTPNIIPLGGLHIRKLQPMPGILQSIIDNANQGFIFFSAGTDIQQNIFSPETKQLFANAFMNLSQKTIMWKDNIDDEDHPFNDRPSNILIHKWVPQNEILGHPHTKLFITTGGSLSIQEAIYHGVPVLGIPIYDEHHRNIQFIVDRHLGLKLDYNDLTEETISASINAILQNPIYLENMDQLATKFRDQPQSPVQKAMYWIEYVLRHNATGGAGFLTPKSRFSSFYGTYSTDVELFLLFVAILITILTISLGIFALLTILSNRNKSKSGNVEVVFKADATVSAVKVNGVNIVSTSQKTFYLDWNENGQVTFSPSELKVGGNSDSLAHFYWIQNGASNQFHIEFHYVMVDGVSGIYSWAKYINSQSGTVSLGETRTIYRFDSSILTQGTNQARSGTLYLYSYLNTQTKVQDETWQLADGTYYTKYDYAGYLRETSYQGVYGNGYGAFVVSPSREYHAGGPLKQDLLIHQDSLIANYFVSSHFGTSGLTAPAGWTHIYGPWLIYFNTGSDSAILSDVASRAQTEKGSWPYSFVNDDAYPRSRGTVTGKVTGQPKAAVMLYDSSETFDDQQLGYAFTTESDSSGSYTLTNVRPGTYNVVAYPLAGQGSENLATSTVTVAAGGTATVSTLNLPEPSNIIWNIGETDRRSDEFKYSNEPRNYLYETLPPETLTFVIGSSSAANDWYYSQSKAGIWTIQYEDTQDGNGRTLRVALAAASQSPHLIVNINGHKIGDIYFDNDQSVYRSAMQSGKFHSNIFTANNAQIVSGTNVITLQVSKGQVMYDAISLQRG